MGSLKNYYLHFFKGFRAKSVQSRLKMRFFKFYEKLTGIQYLINLINI